MPQSVLKVDGSKVRELRDRAGLTQKEFAAALSTDPAHLSRIERGLGQPSIKLRSRILARLGVAVDAILQTTEPEREIAA
jgi:transcriptional regulator with XRE-family HTH domain